MTARKTPKIGCIVSSFAFVAFAAIVYFEFLSHHDVELKLGYCKGGLLAVTLLVVGLVAADFTYRVTSDYYSFRSLWIHYLSLLLLRSMAYVAFKSLVRQSRKVAASQEKLLLKWLADNSSTHYGRDHSFSNISSVQQFKLLHPLTKYQHYEKYIDDIYNGQTNVMSPSQPYILAMTSGTSGTPKMLPTSKKGQTTFFFKGILPVFHILFTHMEGLRNLQKKLKFFYTPRFRSSPSGLPIGPNSSSPKNSQLELSFHSTPAAAFDILSEPEALYVYLLFGLKDRKLGYLEANFASLIYTAFVSMERNWKDLVSDIRNGSVNETLNIDSGIRNKLNAQLSADCQRADELQTEFERGFLGIARKIWPFMNFILCVDSGSFQVYGQLLRQGYCKGLQIYSPIYAATEGIIGINLWPFSEDRQYMLLPSAMFYEFIPISDSIQDQPETLLMHQVEKNEVYEMVISNSSGLYRYRFGDVIKVVDFQNELPLVEFMYRQGQLLNVRGEKTSEKLFYDSFHAAFQTVFPKRLLVDYCCAEQLPTSGDVSPRYLVYIELRGDMPSKEMMKEMEQKLDERLMESYIYKSFRSKGSIAPVSLSLLAPGTFSKLRLGAIGTNQASPNQFKVPRVVRKVDTLKFIQSNVI
ncbi:GH3 domain-containing protein-like [Watersipora subatra]|uniref:GH3 domain-containing protein-like n=1 Tax=Watersipora subatra TaxID=2589382 RepID=UPI00355C4E0D